MRVDQPQAAAWVMLVVSALAGWAAPAVAQTRIPQVPDASPQKPLTQRPRGIYVGSSAGSNFLPGETVADPGWAHLDPGLALSGNAGFAVGNGLRVDLELDYRENHLSQVTFEGVRQHARGTQKTLGTMVNAYYDIPLLSWATPYVGFGGGYQWTGWLSTQFNGPSGTGLMRVNDPLGGFAFQGISGIAVPFPAVSGLSVTAEYRFMDVVGHKSFEGTSASAAGIVPARVTVGNNLNHTILFGVRYSFGWP